MNEDRKAQIFGMLLIAVTALFVVCCCIIFFIKQSSGTKVSIVHAEIYEISDVEIIKGDGTLNINTATVEELMDLPGIGRTRAESIIAFREANGGFVSITQLRFVSGIGEGIYENIRDLVTVGE